MKGVVFTEFLDLIETIYGLEVLEDLIEVTAPPNGGAYTAVGTYDHGELVDMVVNLSRMKNIPVPQLLYTFGESMFPQLMGLHGELVQGIKDPFELFSNLHEFIHVEVAKLYPDAELPQFTYKKISADTVEMLYLSSRPFASLAEGLLDGCGKFYSKELAISRYPEPEVSETDVKFIIKRISPPE